MLRSLYARTLRLSASPYAWLWLFAIAFAEASFFPLPPDLLLVPMILARPQRGLVLATICTAGSVIGGCFGYWIGATLFDSVALPVVRFYHAEAGYHAFLAFYARWGFWAIIAKGLTPIPFKLVTIASGAAHFNFGAFILASIITRGGRFFLLEAIPLRIYGDRARDFIDRRLPLVLGATFAAAVVGILMLHYI